MPLTVSSYVELEVTRCGECGVEFAVPVAMLATARREGGFFHCPNGHNRGWAHGTEQTEIKRLEREKAALTSRLDQVKAEAQRQRELKEAAERREIAQKGQATIARNKLKRVARGTCPCCNRSFQNLRRHMETKHPGQVADASQPDAV